MAVTSFIAGLVVGAVIVGFLWYQQTKKAAE